MRGRENARGAERSAEAEHRHRQHHVPGDKLGVGHLPDQQQVGAEHAEVQPDPHRRQEHGAVTETDQDFRQRVVEVRTQMQHVVDERPDTADIAVLDAGDQRNAFRRQHEHGERDDDGDEAELAPRGEQHKAGAEDRAIGRHVLLDAERQQQRQIKHAVAPRRQRPAGHRGERRQEAIRLEAVHQADGRPQDAGAERISERDGGRQPAVVQQMQRRSMDEQRGDDRRRAVQQQQHGFALRLRQQAVERGKRKQQRREVLVEIARIAELDEAVVAEQPEIAEVRVP